MVTPRLRGPVSYSLSRLLGSVNPLSVNCTADVCRHNGGD